MLREVPRTRGRKRWIILGIVALLLGLLYVVGPMVAAPILRQRLQAMVSKHLNAQLAMDRLSYHFPYGLNLHNAALVAWDEKGEKIDLLRVKELDLHLLDHWIVARGHFGSIEDFWREAQWGEAYRQPVAAKEARW